MKYFKDKINILSLRLSDEDMRKLKEIRLYYGFGSNTKTILNCINYYYSRVLKKDMEDMF